MAKQKFGILVVSFGTSYAKTRKATIEACEKRITEAFPDWEVRRAFTSYGVIEKLKLRDDLHIDRPEEALDRMKVEGFTDVTVQPLHLLPGIEFHKKVIKKIAPFRGSFSNLTVGDPVLCTIEDYRLLVDAFKAQMPTLGEGEAVVLMGHGTSHPSNAAYSCLQLFLWDAGMPVFVATIEGYPELTDIIPKLKEKGFKKVTLMPLMLVAGEHVTNDMAGEREGSWKTVLRAEGFEVNIYAKGLGENNAFQDIYVEHITRALDLVE